MLKETIGKRSALVKNTVERGAVQKFAEAIGDPAPIFIDEEVGKNSRYKRNIAPATFPVTFRFWCRSRIVTTTEGAYSRRTIFSL